MVINTRPISDLLPDDRLTSCLTAAGYDVIACPAITLTHNPDSLAVDRDVKSKYRTAVFVSATGVAFFLEILRDRGIKLADWSKELRIAAMGTGTARALENQGLKVNLVPMEPNSANLGAELTKKMPGPYLLVRADRGSRELSELLAAAGKKFIESVAYVSRDVEAASDESVQRLERNEIRWVTMTSAAIAESTIRMFGDRLKQTCLICISENVADVARRAGCEQVWVAKTASFESMIRTMKHAER